ncbi:MAG: lipid A biosynthesis acyltransferase [Wenzhouxiangella sp.]|nr:MAG: lipid A biosynthesis acyltransferase [Wenzhouxiangella sp.]
MKLFLARSLIRMLSWLPLRLCHALALPLGWLLDRLPLRKQAVIDTHLALAFPELDALARRRLRRAHWVEMARLALEMGAVWHWSERRLLRHIVAVEGWEHVAEASARGQGFLLVGAHLGNWEILSLYVSLRLPMTCLYKAPANARVDALLTDSRQRFGGRLVASGSPAMRELLKALRAGGGIGLLADQQPKQGEGVFAPLFGVPALTMTLVNRLARRTGCAVLLASTRRLSGGRGWTIRFEPAGDRIADEDPATANSILHRWLEARIREAPAQYLWSYKRFSIRPPDASPLYPR